MEIYSKDNYFESKFQLRPYDEEVFEFIKHQLRNSNCKISKEEMLKEGLDLYLSSNKFAIALAKKLKKRFLGDVKVTKSLYTKDRQTSRLIYRLTVCFRLKKEDL